MKGKFLVLFVAFILTFNASAFDELTWGSPEIAKVNIKEMAQRARSFLAKEAPELKDVKIKLLEISAGYREGKKRLFVSFYHEQSYRKGSEETMVAQTSKGEIKKQFITFDIVVVEFDNDAQPKCKEIYGQKYAGSKEDFINEFNQSTEH